LQRDNILWILAIALYGFGDTITTLISLSKGYRELNPIVNLQSIIFLKILIIFILFLIYRKLKSVLIPVLLVIFGLIGTVTNLRLLEF